MTILVAYATNSSGTLTASKIVAEKLAERQHSVTHKDIREVEPQQLSEYDVIVFGSPSWDYKSPSGRLEGMPHEFFRTFIQKTHGLTFPGKKFAVFGLGDSAYINFCGAADRLESFVESLQGNLVLSSLRIDGFYFDQVNNEAKVASWAEELASVLQNGSVAHEAENTKPEHSPVDQV